MRETNSKLQHTGHQLQHDQANSHVTPSERGLRPGPRTERGQRGQPSGQMSHCRLSVNAAQGLAPTPASPLAAERLGSTWTPERASCPVIVTVIIVTRMQEVSAQLTAEWFSAPALLQKHRGAPSHQSALSVCYCCHYYSVSSDSFNPQ